MCVPPALCANTYGGYRCVCNGTADVDETQSCVISESPLVCAATKDHSLSLSNPLCDLDVSDRDQTEESDLDLVLGLVLGIGLPLLLLLLLAALAFVCCCKKTLTGE